MPVTTNSFHPSPAITTICHSTPSKVPPLHISTNPTDINPFHLSQLYTQCNHSIHRFPNITPSTGKVEPLLQLDKLRKAISHSSIVVSVFAKPDPEYGGINMGIGGGWVRNMIPVTPQNGRLVGFGRAVSDFGLTASIYDVMVIPYLQRRGIGRMIVQRILRILNRRDVYDIAALCSEKERPFFKACAFGDDILGSTTMMYSRTSPTDSEENPVVAAGRKLLWLPPDRKNFNFSSQCNYSRGI
ncbi:acetyltransferase [Lithospermum erythrorhizon]|uniref:Acetyltransferase n=1 Tax=Lithospermum erythrorhizon TaxID=34254 RepID=A0AAV3R4F6_LITER